MNNCYLPVKSEIISIVKETTIDYTFRVKYDIPVSGGQFLQVSLPGAGEAPMSVSDFDNGYVDLTIRNVGKLTSEIFRLTEGNSLYLRGPYGNGFNLSKFNSKKLIIVAGGTGLVPVKNVINTYYKNIDELKSFDMILGFKTPDDILFKSEIENWKSKINLILTVDKTRNAWNGKVGLVTKYIRDLNIIPDNEYSVIVVGPPVMIKFATLELIKNGIKENQIFVSYERNMSCGVGKCGHCKIGSRYVCLDGPVFNYTEAKTLVD